jgi:hypothetical protein
MVEPDDANHDTDDGYDDRPDDDRWTEDPNAPQGVDATLDAMVKDLRKLTRASAIATVGVALVLVIAEAANGGAFNVTRGFVVGAVLATMNLWVLAGGYFAIVDRRATALRVLLATVGSLTLLLGVALWIVVARREWSVGFGLGLAVPALGGIVDAQQNQPPHHLG